jgi:hypothetical protein
MGCENGKLFLAEPLTRNWNNEMELGNSISIRDIVLTFSREFWPVPGVKEQG